MAKKLFGGGKKKADPAPASALPKPVLTALSPEETKRRRLLPKTPIGLDTSVLGGGYTSSTLGG